MAIWGFYGMLGNGKDTLANYFLRLKHKKGKRIITHCELNLPHISLSIDDIFQKSINDTNFFRNTILYISEFHLIVDSRRSNASVNVDFSQNILIQLGKIDCDFFYTAQLLSQIDLRVKEMQKYFFFVEKIFRLNTLNQEQYDMIDWDSRIVINPTTKQPVPFDIKIEYLERKSENTFNSGKSILPWEIIKDLVGQFNTREIIKFNRNKYLKT